MAESAEIEQVLFQLKELADVEARLVKLLPKLSAGSACDQIREIIATHVAETEEHAARLKKAAKALGLQLLPRPCPAVDSIVQAGNDALAGEERSLRRDIRIVAAARQAEHLEIGRYSSVCSLLKKSGDGTALRLMEKTLQEEEHADRLLAEAAAEIKTGAIHPAPFPAD